MKTLITCFILVMSIQSEARMLLREPSKPIAPPQKTYIQANFESIDSLSISVEDMDSNTAHSGENRVILSAEGSLETRKGNTVSYAPRTEMNVLFYKNASSDICVDLLQKKALSEDKRKVSLKGYGMVSARGAYFHKVTVVLEGCELK